MPSELKSVLKELFAFKKYLIIVAITGITGAACKGYIALFIQQMIDAASNPDKLRSMAWVGVALAFGIGVSRYFHIFLMNMAAEKVSQALRQKLQTKFMKLNLKFHNNYAAGSGGLISRTMNDIRIVHDGLRLFADLFSAPLVFIFLIRNLFVLDAQLTIYILFVTPLLAIFLKKISRGIRKYSIFGIEQLEKITATIKESLDGVRTIQAFNLEKRMETRLKQQGGDFIYMRRKVHALIESMGPITEFIATFLILGVVFYFSQKISLGLATAGTLIGFITALLQVNEPIKKFQEAYVRIQETRVAAARVFSMLDEDSEVEEAQNPIPFPENWQTIQYKNVHFSYGEEKLLQDFNLTIRKGQVVAFVGESGSGKSTLANLLARFYDPQKGEILIGDRNIRDIQLSALRHNIGLVSQDVFLFSDTIENNILAEKDGPDHEGVERAAKAAHAHDFISRLPLQYNTQTGERGNLLSGGEKQRVGIARAFYKDSPILILDEATSALDSISEEQVQRGLETLMKGRTTFVIAHRLSTVQNADLILVLNKGKIVEQGTHSELLSKKGEYSKLFEMQMR
ncbi:ABC transporter ATP-binding protein [Pseudobdellovibrio exovorus]|uniref:ABC transporter, nucleotide binding/ATPase protein n=1 Tax=Pseudobdellovibrio exovorus JSS TaxID=1184267 RepID=M4V7G3_9BACT|nr:ABC transporter ATP-binding protein [Pseudobdellovibrio exovorus]AGH94375.1 ABC transporter, nucleotide binding/ATPase protein [Pseudobdellovibrio exovorus JSS]